MTVVALRTHPREQRVGGYKRCPWNKDKKKRKNKRKDTRATRFEDNYGNHSPAMAPEMLVGIS